MKNSTRILCIGLAVLSMVGCKKEDEKIDNNNNGSQVNALVLNEGVWGLNNSSISGLNTADGKVDNDWFVKANNNRELGDVAQDMIAYGSKVYATVTFSNSLEVINPKTGASQRIDLGDRNPRHIAADGGKLYITCYNPCSVIRIDTASLEVEATCNLGQYHPEGIAIAQGKAFVASSVTADYSAYDDALYVINLSTFANPTTVSVGVNPSIVKKVSDSKILVCYAGNYVDVMGGSAIVDVNTLDVTQTYQELAGAAVYNGIIYGYASTWVEDPDTHEWNQTIGYFMIDLATMDITPLNFSNDIASPYGIDINPANGDIYVCESISGANGKVHCFSISGTHRFTSEVGIFPKKVVVF